MAGAALYRADPSDVTLAGTSAGRHLAALLLTWHGGNGNAGGLGLG